MGRGHHLHVKGLLALPPVGAGLQVGTTYYLLVLCYEGPVGTWDYELTFDEYH